MTQPKVINPPERIFLNVGDIDRDCSFEELSLEDITWTADGNVDNADIEYRLVKRRRRFGGSSPGEPT